MAAPTTPDAVMQARADVRGKRVVLIDAINLQAHTQTDLTAALRSTVPNPTDPNNAVTIAQAALTAATQNLANARTAERTSRATLAAAIATWLKDGTAVVSADVDVQRLQASQPIVMFPVRLETRFDTAGTTLRVRVYPDELSLDIHERALTDEEKAAGQQFYTGLVLSDLVEEAKRWQDLAGRFGAPRAAYIARVMRPFTHQDGSYPTYPVCSDEWVNEPPNSPLQFPVLPARSDVWTRPGEAVLPDRWVVVGYRGGRQVLLKAGNPIPEPLPLTQDPGGDATTTADGFSIDQDLLWTIEYATAEQIGMAITIGTGDDAGVAQGYDRLVVVGVKSSLVPFADNAADQPPGVPPPDTAMYLERLLDAHHYTRGLAVVPQGTPTNNTAGTPTSFPPDDPFGEKSFPIEREPPPFHRTISYHCPTDNGDVDPLSRALGVPNGVFLNVDGVTEIGFDSDHVKGLFDTREQYRAGLMNEALWPVTWGYFLEHMMSPVLSGQLDTVNGTARAYFRTNVRGRGPAPAFRVGAVPYGVLPAISLARWRPTGSGPDDVLEQALIPRLRVLRDLFKTAADAKAARIAPGASDPFSPLVDVLAQQASAGQIRVRNCQGFDTVVNTGGMLGLSVTQIAALLNKNAKEIASVIAEPTWTQTRVLGLGEAFRSGEFIDPLVTGGDAPSPAFYVRALAGASLDALVNDTVLTGTTRPLFYLMVRHALMLEYCRLARRAVPPFMPPTEIELWGFTFFDNVPFADRMRDHFADLQVAAGPYLGKLFELADRLAEVPIAEAERLFTETLDLASHRLDAWITAVATRRLMTLRHSQETLHGKPVGSYLGGYAWVENVRRASSTASNGGYIHAPSMPQAAAAAILRSGQQSGGQEAPEKYAVDLSSERVRLGRRLLDEVREGQTLGAVLGYRFERGLRDNHPDVTLRESYIIALRNLCPLVANKSQTDVNVPADTIAARNVVDGLALRAKHKANTIPFGSNGLPSPNGTAAEKAAVAAIKAELDALDNLVDAVADLVTGESVYQLVRGNVSGASATLDALARGLRPPDPEIARSPRGGTGVTHRIAVAFSGAVPEASGWPVPAPLPERADRARDLDRIVGRLLGDPSNVKAVVTYRVGSGPTVVADVFLGPHTGAKSVQFRPLELVSLARAATKENQGSLLDRYLMDAAIGAQTGVTEASVAYDAGSAATLSVPQLMEVARSIGASFAGVRPLTADDLLPPAESSDAGATTAAPEAQALVDSARQARAALTAAAVRIDGASGPAALRDALKAAATFDPTAFPDPLADATALAAAASASSAELKRRVTASAGLDSPGTNSGDLVRAAVAGFQAIFGKDFVPLVVFTAKNAGELGQSLAAVSSLLPGAGDAAAPLQMLEQAARVREPLARCRRVALYAGAIGRTQPTIRLAQIPFVAGEGWVGPRPSATEGPPAGRVSHLLLVPEGAILDASGSLQGLLLDQWVEIVPAANEETGVAFHFDNPGAEAPQAVLSAVPPAADGKWTFADLLATVNETLDLAHIRVLEPEDLPAGLGQGLPAIYMTHHSLAAVPSTEFPTLADDPTFHF